MLYVDPKVAQRFVGQKARRAYTNGKKRDIHEADLTHLRRAAAAYRYVAKKYGWKTIDCMRGKKVIPIDEVHELIYKTVKNFL